jgi:hypothetical protein
LIYVEANGAGDDMPLATNVEGTVLKKAIAAMLTYPLNPGHKFQTGGTYAETPIAEKIIGYTELTAAENAVLVLASTSAFKDDSNIAKDSGETKMDSSLVGDWIGLARLLTVATT